MTISKTTFINYTRCPRYCSLDNIKKERLNADITYKEYQDEEKFDKLLELISGMYDEDEEGNDIDLIDKIDPQLEAMLDYYKQVEIETAKIVKKTFKGNSIFAIDTKDQKCFTFTKNGLKYLCYLDIYNENDTDINIIEVKATTSNKYMKLSSSHPNQPRYSIWTRINNINYLKDELENCNIEDYMPLKKYQDQRSKLLNRYKLGKYIYDIAVQRYFIENAIAQNKELTTNKKINYYLAVLNHEYIFDGTYENNKPIYNTDDNGNELITFFNVTKLVEELHNVVATDDKLLEEHLTNLDASPCKLGPYCEYKTKNQCKFFNTICGSMIPKKNSSLNYIKNGQGFVKEDGTRIKGLELINEGYINMLDIPENWITRKTHHLQRDALIKETPYINKEKLKLGLEQLEYPIYHLDFETFPCPVPRFKGEWPYIQSPFEFSLHIENAPGICDNDKDNFVFLAKSHEDEREELIKAMLKYMDPNKGTLFAQNVAFEKGRIKELASIFPKYKEDLLKLYERGFDLLWLVDTNSKMYEELGYEEEDAKVFNFYDKRLSGSFSIKKTLPVFSDLSYANLDVKNGTEAIVEYANYPKMSKEEFNFKYQALITYCKQDTWAMVVILEALRKLIKEK